MKEWRIPKVENLDVKNTETICHWWMWNGLCIWAPCAPSHWSHPIECGTDHGNKPDGCDEVTES